MGPATPIALCHLMGILWHSNMKRCIRIYVLPRLEVGAAAMDTTRWWLLMGARRTQMLAGCRACRRMEDTLRFMPLPPIWWRATLTVQKTHS